MWTWVFSALGAGALIAIVLFHQLLYVTELRLAIVLLVLVFVSTAISNRWFDESYAEYSTRISDCVADTLSDPKRGSWWASRRVISAGLFPLFLMILIPGIVAYLRFRSW